MNIARLGYALHAHTKADYFLSFFLHLATCTTKYLFTPYVTHNQKSISVRLNNGQFGSFPNQHFFEQTSFENFELLEPKYFRNRLIVTYTCIQNEEEEEEATLSPLMDIMETDEDETDDDGSSDISIETAVLPLPYSSPVLTNDTNLPFMQTFIANIFIY